MVSRSQSLSSVDNLSSVSDITDAYAHLSRLATIESAERHMNARRVRKLQGLAFDEISPEELCPCCQLPVPENDGERCFTWRSDCREFAELGAAIPMYFLMMRHLGGMLAFVLIAAIPNIVGNILYGHQSDGTAFGLFSIKGSGSDLSWWNSFLYLLVLVWLCSLYLITKNRLKWWAKHLRGDYITMADFSVTVKGLGEDWDRKDLITHIQDFMKVGGQEVKIESITTSYDVTELLETVEKYEELRRERERANYPDLVSGLCCTCIKDSTFHTALVTEDQYKREAKEIEDALGKLLSKQHLRKTGVAIVTFATIPQAERFYSLWGESAIRQVFTAFGIECKSNPVLRFNGRPMHVTRAMEPFDVLWENLGYTPCSRILRQLVTAAILSVFLMLSFLVVSVSALGNGYLNTHSGYGLVTSTIFSLIIVIANKILAIIVSLLPTFECHHSKTGEALFSAVKVTFVQVINTLLDPLLLDVVMYEIAPNQPSQLANNVTMTCILMVFVETLLDVVPDVSFWWVKKWWTLRKLRLGQTFITQLEANEAVELPEPEVAIWYGETLVKFLYALAYCPYAPIIIPITMAGFLLEYWLKKIFVIKFCTRPVELNERLALSMIAFVRIGFLSYGISTFFSVYLCLYDVRTGATVVALVCALVGFVFCLSPSIGYKCCFSWVFSMRPTPDIDYSACSPHFLYVNLIQRYKDSNPVTKYRAQSRLHGSLNPTGSLGPISPATVAAGLQQSKKAHHVPQSAASSRKSSRSSSTNSVTNPLLQP